ADVGDVHAGDIAPLEHDAAGRRGNLAGQHLEEGRFAGSIGPDDAVQLTAIHREIDVAVGDKAAVSLGQPGRTQDRARTVAAFGALRHYWSGRRLFCDCGFRSLLLRLGGRTGRYFLGRLLAPLAHEEAIEVD